MNALIYLFFGLLFGLGLAFSGMTNPEKVLGFLDLFGNWDPTLMFVIASGVGTTMLAYHFIFKRRPIINSEFCLPNKQKLDKRLIIGSVLFGVGWGLYGYCPGPAIAALSYLHSDTFLFVAAMLGGTIIHTVQGKKQP
ncbi:DUF6691 family protein [Oleiphilus sp. HI0086]|uniref:DUF6691 family protein n=1 Tax=Oleiphilus sp. HI0086 TaxID=1822260 RepID=UPI0007C3D39E|nr:DUF6691 family protein [Oleiphilus sp. HI0086]KZZ34642.1 transporter [Oleiphilus sp. HI0086]